LALLLASAAWGDTVTLVNGTKLEGVVRRQGDAWQLTDPAGKVINLPDDQIALIEKTGNVTDAQRVANQLAALRRDAESVADPAAAVNRFLKFIDQHPGTSAATDAQTEVQLWHDRSAAKLVKAGTKWVTADEYNTLMTQAIGLVEQARQQYKAGAYRDAETAIASILALDANNVSALYLRGLLLVRRDQNVPARKAFERVLALMPDHAPTLNNLAVLSWRQKLYGSAMGFYDKAMIAAPRNRQVLDNVAEALHALPPELADPAITKATARFDEQDAELQKELADQGLHRRGGSYLTDVQLRQLEADKDKTDAKQSVIDTDFIRTRQQIVNIESAIELNVTRLQQFQTPGLLYDVYGNLWVRPQMPSLYWQIARETEVLRNDRQALVEKLATLTEKTRQLQQESSPGVGGYTGKQRLIESEGTPLKPPAPIATTRPGE
jgi:tetratricopeptide (TPR) repeat protein